MPAPLQAEAPEEGKLHQSLDKSPKAHGEAQSRGVPRIEGHEEDGHQVEGNGPEGVGQKALLRLEEGGEEGRHGDAEEEGEEEPGEVDHLLESLRGP